MVKFIVKTLMKTDSQSNVILLQDEGETCLIEVALQKGVTWVGGAMRGQSFMEFRTVLVLSADKPVG